MNINEMTFSFMKIHQITIKDIARELGVSISTVSRALKDHPDISPQTKQMVRNLVKNEVQAQRHCT